MEKSSNCSTVWRMDFQSLHVAIALTMFYTVYCHIRMSSILWSGSFSSCGGEDEDGSGNQTRAVCILWVCHKFSISLWCFCNEYKYMSIKFRFSVCIYNFIWSIRGFPLCQDRWDYFFTKTVIQILYLSIFLFLYFS